MRRRWLVPCSVIKWRPDGVRGRQMISSAPQDTATLSDALNNKVICVAKRTMAGGLLSNRIAAARPTQMQNEC